MTEPSGEDHQGPHAPTGADLRAALDRVDAELAQVRRSQGRTPDERRDLPLASDPLDQNCRALLAVVRKRCPELLRADDLPPGDVGRPVPLPAEESRRLIVTAVRQAVATAVDGRPPRPDSELPAAVLWQEGVDRLLVRVGSIEIGLGEGEIGVHIPVACDQVPDGHATVSVRIVVGTPERPTGLFAAVSTVPEGPPVVVLRWGEALTALAWTAVLDVARGVARRAGRDTDGAGLVPVAVVASRNGILVLPQARHLVDRATA